MDLLIRHYMNENMRNLTGYHIPFRLFLALSTSLASFPRSDTFPHPQAYPFSSCINEN